MCAGMDIKMSDGENKMNFYFVYIMGRMRTHIDEDQPDPENGLYSVVSYKRNLTREQQKNKQRKNAIEQKKYQEAMNDPMLKYEWEKNEYEQGYMNRLSKQPGYQSMTQSELRKHICGPGGQEYMPIILMKQNSAVKEETRSYKRANNQQRELGSHEKHRIETNAEEGNYQRRFFSKNFIDKVKTMRLKYDPPLSQSDVAQMINVNVKIISQLEKGELEFDNRLKTLLLWKLESGGE